MANPPPPPRHRPDPSDGQLTATIRRTDYSHHQTDGLQLPSDGRLTATIRRTAYSHHQTDSLQPPSDGRLTATIGRTAYNHQPATPDADRRVHSNTGRPLSKMLPCPNKGSQSCFVNVTLRRYIS
jgi:hypothetical protein